MHTNIDEGAERRDVGYGAFEDHAALEILQRLDPLLEHRGLEGRARIAAGLFQLAQNVGHRRQAKGIIDETLRFDLAQGLRIADQRLDVALGRGKNLAHDGIGLRMDAGGIERIITPRDAQEAGALLKRFRPRPSRPKRRLPTPRSSTSSGPAASFPTPWRAYRFRATRYRFRSRSNRRDVARRACPAPPTLRPSASAARADRSWWWQPPCRSYRRLRP